MYTDVICVSSMVHSRTVKQMNPEQLGSKPKQTSLIFKLSRQFSYIIKK